MTMHGHGPHAVMNRTYWWLCAALLMVTLIEWTAFIERHHLGIATGLLVPGLLTAAALKFFAAVGWLMRVEGDIGWRGKALIVALVMAGGGILLPRLFMMGPMP